VQRTATGDKIAKASAKSVSRPCGSLPSFATPPKSRKKSRANRFYVMRKVSDLSPAHYKLLQECWMAVVAAVSATGFHFFDIRKRGFGDLLSFCRMARHLGDLAERSGISYAIATIK